MNPISLDNSQKSLETRDFNRSPIAIVGIGCRYPGINDTNDFWNVLKNGTDVIKQCPKNRSTAIKNIFSPSSIISEKIATKRGGFLENIHEFDADFFGISPREASRMDPQHIMLLEVTWEAIENAGLVKKQIYGSKTGVFIGMWSNDHEIHLAGSNSDLDLYSCNGGGRYAASGRISYIYNLLGPSVSIDTACSSSLVSVHLACQSIHSGESDMAFAGGVNLILQPSISVAYTKAKILSPDGKCKFGDASANGYVRGEGCGIIFLKRLKDAIKDNDRIYSVILGSAVNHNGQRSLFVAPSQEGQESAIRQAYKNASIQPDKVNFIEAHGTGTAAGDPVEINAIGSVLCKNRKEDNILRVGSVKTNIGHTEAASGVASIIKTSLCLYNRSLPPSLHFKKPNPNVPWKDYHLKIQTDYESFPNIDSPLIAGINSTGISGTNAHVVMQEFVKSNSSLKDIEPTRFKQRDSFILPISSKNSESLSHSLKNWREFFIEANLDRNSLLDICHTASVRKNHFSHRKAFFAHSREDFISAITKSFSANPNDESSTNELNTKNKKLIFTFPGSEHTNFQLFSYLLESEPAFRDFFDHCALSFEQETNFSLYDIISSNFDKSPINKPQVLFPLSFVFEFGIYRLFLSWGIKPDLVNGYGAGIISSLYAMGKLDLSQSIQACKYFGLLFGKVKSSSNSEYSKSIDRYKKLLSGINLNDSSDEVSTFLNLNYSSIESMIENFSQLDVQSDDLFNPTTFKHIENYHCFIIEPGPSSTFNKKFLTQFRAKFKKPATFSLFDEVLPSTDSLYITLCNLYSNGFSVNWDVFYRSGANHVSVPSYSWTRKNYVPDIYCSIPEKQPIWRDIVSAGIFQSDQVPVGLSMDSYGSGLNHLHTITISYIISTFEQLRVPLDQFGTFTLNNLLEKAGIPSKFEKLVGNWLDLLFKENIITRQDNQFTFNILHTKYFGKKILNDAFSFFGEDSKFLAYIRHCGEILPDVLTERKNPLESLFPGGSFRFAEYIYYDWDVFRYYNNIAAVIAQSFYKTHTLNKKSKILEIGAGTGGTTNSVLPFLPADKTTYYFTDVSKLFLNHAAERFAKFNFIEYCLFDIEKDPASQGYNSHDFDMVIAANVLHATFDIKKTLSHVISIMAPGGILILFELTSHLSWFDITFGQIDGWQKFEDSWRKDSPLINTDLWNELLINAGFENITLFPAEGSKANELPGNIIICQVPEHVDLTVLSDDHVCSKPLSSSGDISLKKTSSVFHKVTPLSVHDDLSSIEKKKLISDFIAQHVKKILDYDVATSIDSDIPLMDIGFDSLMALELRSIIANEMKIEDQLTETFVFDYPTIESMSDYLSSLQYSDPGALTNSISVSSESDAGKHSESKLSDLNDISDEDAEKMLIEKLKSIDEDI